MSTVKHLKSLLPKNDPVPKFGCPENTVIDKINCNEIYVFICAHSGLSGIINVEGDRRRFCLPPNTTLRDAVRSFDSKMTFDLIKDENNFMFSKDDLNQPISKFSNHCRLNINLYHSHESRYNGVVNALNPRSRL